MAINFKKELGKYKSQFKKGKKRAEEFGQGIPPSTYEGKVTVFQLEKAKKDQHLQARTEIVISDGEQEGMTAKTFRNLAGQKGDVGFSFLCQEIEFFGYDVPEDVADIDAVMKEIEGEELSVRFNISINAGGFRNVRLLELLSEGEGEDEGEGGGEEEGEETPDFDEMDKDELLEYISENDLEASDLEFKSEDSMKKKKKDVLAAALDEYYAAGEVEGEDEGEGEDGDDKLLNSTKELCISQDIEVADDDDLDALKEKIGEFEYFPDTCTQKQLKTMEGFEDSKPSDGLSSDDIELMEELELSELIMKPKKEEKKSTKKSSKKKRK